MAGSLRIQWVSHPELSAAHAAYVVATGAKCIDEKTEQVLIPPVTEANNRLLASSIDVSQFWRQYLIQIMSDVDMDQACELALLSAGGHEMQVEQTSKAIASRLADARVAFMRRFPKLAEQLELRARPLRERWDTYGPGLLGEIGKQVWGDSTPDDWWKPQVTALTVQPIRGGDGGCDASQSRLWFEAMLTDVDPRVPEVLRVAWLVSRIAIESHARQNTADLRMMMPWSLVSVPLVLSAASTLELIHVDTLPISKAMELWQFGDGRTAETLAQWWSDQHDDSGPLPAKLRQLGDRLEGNAGPESVADLR